MIFSISFISNKVESRLLRDILAVAATDETPIIMNVIELRSMTNTHTLQGRTDVKVEIVI